MHPGPVNLQGNLAFAINAVMVFGPDMDTHGIIVLAFNAEIDLNKHDLPDDADFGGVTFGNESQAGILGNLLIYQVAIGHAFPPAESQFTTNGGPSITDVNGRELSATNVDIIYSSAFVPDYPAT